MAPDHRLVSDSSPTPLKSTAADCPSIHDHIRNFGQDTGLGWDHEVKRPHNDRMNVLAVASAARLLLQIAAMRRSKGVGGSWWGVDMVTTVEILGEGRRGVAMMPPIECP
jgi:hypothetical protein